MEKKSAFASKRKKDKTKKKEKDKTDIIFKKSKKKIVMRKDVKNLQTIKLIDGLYRISKDKNKDIYSVIAMCLETPARKNKAVNLSKLQKLSYILDGDVIVIPGKLLGFGDLNKNITIYANGFSKSVVAKYKNIKPLSSLLKDDVDYKKIKIIK